MASVNDVYNQLVTANGTLTQLHGDLVAETNATDQVKASVDQLDTDVKNGFATLSNELKTLANLEIEEVQLLFHLTQQADAMICELEHISRNTCEILNQVALQTRLQTRIRDDADALRSIEEFAHPEGALERERLEALRAEIERCCPPVEVPPSCVYEPCPHPAPIKEPKLPRDQPQDRPG